jgi:uncharacterized protein (TIGR01777 family)
VKIVVAGGSGFLGTSLSARLAKDGHAIVVLTRDKPGSGTSGGIRYAQWAPNGETGSWAQEIDGADAIVNLAGAGIADKRWSTDRKQILERSRTLSARSLVNAVQAASRRPGVLIQASAEGYYGSFPDDGPTLDESSPPGSDFLARLCVAWEREAEPLTRLGVRLVIARTTIVLSKDGGALPKMIPPFRMFVGGPLGSGRQIMSWIHLDDWTGMVAWAIQNPAVAGPINLSSPHAVTNAEFSRALGRALYRPSWIPVPAFALRLIVGEMADEALLRGHRVMPAVAMRLGYKFLYERIDDAMAAAVR